MTQTDNSHCWIFWVTAIISPPRTDANSIISPAPNSTLTPNPNPSPNPIPNSNPNLTVSLTLSLTHVPGKRPVHAITYYLKVAARLIDCGKAVAFLSR